jgi:hypothetical protein
VWRAATWRKASCGLCTAVLAACPLAASAQALAFSLEPSVGLGGKPSRALRLPSAASVKALLGFGRYLDFSFGAGLVGLPDLSDSNSPMSGMASTIGVGVRLKRPHDGRSFGGASPWVDAEAVSIQGRAGDRRAVAVGAGLAFPLGHDRGAWLGPFVRHLQVVDASASSRGRRASDGLFAGVSFEVGPAAAPAP